MTEPTTNTDNTTTTNDATDPSKTVAENIAEEMTKMNPQELMSKLLMMKMMSDMMNGGGMGGNKRENAARVEVDGRLLKSQMIVLNSIITKPGYKVTLEDRKKLTGIMGLLVGIAQDKKDGISNALVSLDVLNKKKKKK